MKINTDWHIHSRNSCDQACMTVADLVSGAAARGVVDFGLTDHLQTPFNLPDIERSRAEYDASRPSNRFHFGLEASCVSQWELDEIAAGKHQNPVWGLRSGGKPGCALAIGVARGDIDRLGIEYVVGGVHWPMYVEMERMAVIRDYHRQYLFLAEHPLVDIVAHPWWWQGHWQDAAGNFPDEPWLGDFRRIPAAMHDELAAAAVEHGKKIEINLSANLLNRRYPGRFALQYLEYVAGLKERGVTLCFGSDCHAEHYEPDLETAQRMLESVGITESDLWVMPPRQRTGLR